MAPDAPTMLRRGHSLAGVVANSRHSLPLVVRLTDWRHQTTVLQHHYVTPGVELVLHATTKQTKASRSGVIINQSSCIFLEWPK